MDEIYINSFKTCFMQFEYMSHFLGSLNNFKLTRLEMDIFYVAKSQQYTASVVSSSLIFFEMYQKLPILLNRFEDIQQLNINELIAQMMLGKIELDKQNMTCMESDLILKYFILTTLHPLFLPIEIITIIKQYYFVSTDVVL